LTSDAPVPVRAENIGRLTEFSTAVMRELGRVGITGADGAEIDHVEIFGPPTRPDCQSKNFVLCPGGAYDRSPCGTGTSAKLAVLAADGLLAPGEVWRQESIIGSSFSASFRLSADGKVTPRIEGRAFVTAEGRLRFDADDPFREGIVLSER
jgi:4-hydroxyproline epimerase